MGIVTTKYFWESYNLFLEKLGTMPLKVYFNHPGGAAGTICRFDLSNGILDSGDPIYFYLQDEAGNVIVVTDKTGAMVIEFEQDVWGNDLIGNFTTPVNGSLILQHQSGKIWDAEADLYYNAARWYDPRLGRFVSPSPLAPEEEYAFCGNDPVNYLDVNGLEQIPSDIFLGLLVHRAIFRYYSRHLVLSGFYNLRFDQYLTDYDGEKLSDFRPDISADRNVIRYFGEIKSLYDDNGYSQMARKYLSPFQCEGNEAYPGPRLPNADRIPFPDLSPTAYVRAFPGRLPGIIQYTIHDDGPRRKRLEEIVREIRIKDVPIIVPIPMPYRIPVYVP